MAFAAELAALLEAAAYPHPTRTIRVVETHISWVVLTGEFAYKIKRPVQFAFLDFRTLAAREHFCREELRLNRRFAPELYLAVCPIVRGPRGVRIVTDGVADGADRVVEYAVRMREFDASAELGALLAAGEVGPAELFAFGARLASLHAREPARTRGGAAAEALTLLRENADQCVESAAAIETAAAIRGVRAALLDAGEARRGLLGARERGGRVREGHGDLHTGNIVAFGGELVPFDCLEFDERLRVIDVAEEIAFLTMDLAKRGYPAERAAFLNGYLSVSGDYEACRLLALFEIHFALVRAKVEALRARSAAAERAAALAEHRRYVDFASRRLTPRRPVCILVAGVSGSGKSWLASRLAVAIGAVHVRSDLERKRLAGLPATARAGTAAGSDLYSRERSEQVYRRLADAALASLDGGIDILVDATFRRRQDRETFSARIGALGFASGTVWCHADPPQLRRRIERRLAANADPSDADLRVLAEQLAVAEPPDPGCDALSCVIDTAERDAVERVAIFIELVRAAPARAGPAR